MTNFSMPIVYRLQKKIRDLDGRLKQFHWHEASCPQWPQYTRLNRILIYKTSISTRLEEPQGEQVASPRKTAYM